MSRENQRRMSPIVKRLLFYWTTSFMLATSVYYILWLSMPRHNVFGALDRMFQYHREHPLAFIAIPCLFYGIIATGLAESFSRRKVLGQVLLTIVIIALTVLVSSPFGGMLWHYYDMKAGFFPVKWVSTMIEDGFELGLDAGWLIVGLSIPYNIIGSVICFFLTKKGSELFRNK